MKFQKRKKLFLSIILQVNIFITVHTCNTFVSTTDAENPKDEETAPHDELGMEVSPGKCLPLCMWVYIQPYMYHRGCET